MQKKYENGYSIIEFITIIVLLSVIAVVVFGRLNFTDYSERGFFDQTVTALRYAQKLAVSTGCNVEVTLASNGFELHQRQACDSGAFDLDVVNPGNRSIPYALSNPDVSISPTNSLEFTAESTVDNLGADQSFTVNGQQFTVFRHTALVDVP